MVTALHDGGSEGTLMTSKTFRDIPEYKDIKIKPRPGTYLLKYCQLAQNFSIKMGLQITRISRQMW